MMTSKERFRVQLDRCCLKRIVKAKPVLTGIQKQQQESEWSAELEVEFYNEFVKRNQS